MKNIFRRTCAILVLVASAALGFAQSRDLSETTTSGRKYMTFGRNPVIPGGLTAEQAKAKGWEVFVLPEDPPAAAR